MEDKGVTVKVKPPKPVTKRAPKYSKANAESHEGEYRYADTWTPDKMLEFSNKITYTIIVEKTAEIIGKEPHHGRKMSLVLTDWISKDGSNFLFPCRVRNPHGATPVTLVTEMFMPGTKMAVSKLKANFELLPFPLKAFTEKCVDSTVRQQFNTLEGALVWMEENCEKLDQVMPSSDAHDGDDDDDDDPEVSGDPNKKKRAVKTRTQTKSTSAPKAVVTQIGAGREAQVFAKKTTVAPYGENVKALMDECKRAGKQVTAQKLKNAQTKDDQKRVDILRSTKVRRPIGEPVIGDQTDSENEELVVVESAENADGTFVEASTSVEGDVNPNDSPMKPGRQSVTPPPNDITLDHEMDDFEKSTETPMVQIVRRIVQEEMKKLFEEQAAANRLFINEALKEMKSTIERTVSAAMLRTPRSDGSAGLNTSNVSDGTQSVEGTPYVLPIGSRRAAMDIDQMLLEDDVIRTSHYTFILAHCIQRDVRLAIGSALRKTFSREMMGERLCSRSVQTNLTPEGGQKLNFTCIINLVEKTMCYLAAAIMFITGDTKIEEKTAEEKSIPLPEYNLDQVMEEASARMINGWLTTDIVDDVNVTVTQLREMSHRSNTQYRKRTAAKRSLQMSAPGDLAGIQLPPHYRVPRKLSAPRKKNKTAARNQGETLETPDNPEEGGNIGNESQDPPQNIVEEEGEGEGVQLTPIESTEDDSDVVLGTPPNVVVEEMRQVPLDEALL